MASSRALVASKPTTPALVNQEMQVAKPGVPACAQSLEQLGDENPAVTMVTTTRNGAVEHAVPVRTCKPLLAFPRDLRVRHDHLRIRANVDSENPRHRSCPILQQFTVAEAFVWGLVWFRFGAPSSQIWWLRSSRASCPSRTGLPLSAFPRFTCCSGG